MSLFRRREPPLPKAAVCFSSPIRTRRAADWLRNLGGCRPIGILSDDCDIAIEVRRKLPDCRVYLVCEERHPERLPALEKAAELKLIDGYCLGALTDRQARAWLRETAEAMPGGSAR